MPDGWENSKKSLLVYSSRTYPKGFLSSMQINPSHLMNILQIKS
jgi:hypothetical protein